MSDDSPFAGLKLSDQAMSADQAAPPKLDQRLFEITTPAPSPPPEPKPPPEHVTLAPDRAPTPKPPRKATSKPSPAKPEPVEPLLKPPSLRRAQWDLDDQPLFKASFLFTREELEALEDLKLEIRRDLDTKVTKESLIRAALHLLLEDHHANGKKSYAYKKIISMLGR